MIRRSFWWMEPTASVHWRWEKWSRFYAPNCRSCFQMMAAAGNSTTCVEQITSKSSRKLLKVCQNWKYIVLWTSHENKAPLIPAGKNPFIWDEKIMKYLCLYNPRQSFLYNIIRDALKTVNYLFIQKSPIFFLSRCVYGNRWTLLLVRWRCRSHCLLLHRL